ncbi:MAG: hypothetical protein AAF551_09320 [Bacteroidota bacterium]
MSEIGDLIKKIAREGLDVTHTFPAIVVSKNVLTDNGKKDYVVSVRRLIDVAKEYDVVQKELDSSYQSKDKTTTIADPEDISNLTYENVRLKSAINGIDEGVFCIPRIGSWVLVSTIGNNDNRLYVSRYSEVDQILLRINDTEDTGQYADISLDASNLSLTYGDYFQATIHKEEVSLRFNQEATEEEKKDDQQPKSWSQLSYTKDRLEVSFKNEDEETLVASTISRDDATVTMKDGCQVAVSQTTASMQTKDQNELLRIDENEGVLIKSATKISIEGDEVNIQAKNKDVNIKGTNINLN